MKGYMLKYDNTWTRVLYPSCSHVQCITHWNILGACNIISGIGMKRKPDEAYIPRPGYKDSFIVSVWSGEMRLFLMF